MWHTMRPQEKRAYLAIGLLLTGAGGFVVGSKLRRPGNFDLHAIPSAHVAPAFSGPASDGESERARKTEPAKTSVSLNAGTVEDFKSLPGIGPAIAQRIVDYRAQNGKFGSIEDVTNVKGIGPKRFERIRPYLKL